MEKRAVTKTKRTRRRGLSLLGVLSLCTILTPQPTNAALPCQTTQECVETLRPGSECVDNKCTNPYHRGGCLKQRVEGWKKTRVCHSEDPPDAIERGVCIAPDPNFDYPEVRILAQNWESVFFQAWIIQIVLTEILGIPATLESGTAEDLVDFYHPASALGYGESYDYEALRRGNEVVDCRTIHNAPGEEYQSCAHVMPEVWHGQTSQYEPLLEEGVIDRPGLCGTLGYQGLYIPLFTAANDTSLLTYLGLAGEENRQKLAETFKRPTSWKDYCELVSPHNCTWEDPIAAGYPSEGNENRYHVEGEYTGYFRATDKNDCEKNPTTCTGHVVDYPCGWTSFVEQQTHHLNIALESDGGDPISGGYSYAQMTEIWAAANATRSNVMMQWWTPEALFQTFLGGLAEFTRVDLPPPTDDCIKARIEMEDRCRVDAPEELRLGTAAGACDEPPFGLERLFAQSLVDYSKDQSIPEEVRSPAFETINNIQLDGLQIGKIFDYWLKRNSDRYNFDPRDASCRWVVENYDTIERAIPRTFPRVVEDERSSESALAHTALGFSCAAAVCVGLAFLGVLRNKDKPAIVLAQVNFLYLLLAGLAMVSAASILLNIAPSDFTCVAIAWLVSMGYTFELVPLLFKVGAIASLISASKKFKRVRLEKRKLFTAVLAVGVIVVVFLIVWTCLDPPQKTAEFDLTEEIDEDGDTVVKRTYYCSSDSYAWAFVSIGWQALLLLCGSILAFTTRNMRKDMTESLVVSVLVYSHFMFVILRILHFNFSDNLEVWHLARYLSLIFSCDVICACFIYFFPKLFLEEDTETRDPILPAAFAPPDTVVHMWAYATKGVTKISSAISPMSGQFSLEDESSEEVVALGSPIHVGTPDKEDALSRTALNPPEAYETAPQKSRKKPKDLLFDSLGASDLQNSVSLEFDTLMTASGRRRPADILADEFDYETLHINSNDTKQKLDYLRKGNSKPKRRAGKKPTWVSGMADSNQNNTQQRHTCTTNSEDDDSVDVAVEDGGPIAVQSEELHPSVRNLDEGIQFEDCDRTAVSC